MSQEKMDLLLSKAKRITDENWRERWRFRQKVRNHASLLGLEKWVSKNQKHYPQPLKIEQHPVKDGWVVYYELGGIENDR